MKISQIQLRAGFVIAAIIIIATILFYMICNKSPDKIGFLENPDNDVRQKYSGSKNWIVPGDHSPVYLNDEIETKKNSNVDIHFNNGMQISIFQNSLASITYIDNDAGLALKSGEISATSGSGQSCIIAENDLVCLENGKASLKKKNNALEIKVEKGKITAYNKEREKIVEAQTSLSTLSDSGTEQIETTIQAYKPLESISIGGKTTSGVITKSSESRNEHAHELVISQEKNFTNSQTVEITETGDYKLPVAKEPYKWNLADGKKSHNAKTGEKTVAAETRKVQESLAKIEKQDESKKVEKLSSPVEVKPVKNREASPVINKPEKMKIETNLPDPKKPEKKSGNSSVVLVQTKKNPDIEKIPKKTGEVVIVTPDNELKGDSILNIKKENPVKKSINQESIEKTTPALPVQNDLKQTQGPTVEKPVIKVEENSNRKNNAPEVKVVENKVMQKALQLPIEIFSANPLVVKKSALKAGAGLLKWKSKPGLEYTVSIIKNDKSLVEKKIEAGEINLPQDMNEGNYEWVVRSESSGESSIRAQVQIINDEAIKKPLTPPEIQSLMIW